MILFRELAEDCADHAAARVEYGLSLAVMARYDDAAADVQKAIAHLNSDLL